jgi:hypothetical protein
MTRIPALAALCLVLAGCGKPEPVPDFSLTTVTPAPPKLPLECHRRGDPKWTPFPPKGIAVKTSDILRRNDKNETSFNSLERKRAICDAAIERSGQ